MRAQSRTRSADRAISQFAARQHGVVSRRQLLTAGVTRSQIALRLDAERLAELHRGVYLVGAVSAAHSHEIAALLACRSDDATLSHWSAAAFWSLRPYPPFAPVWITLPPGREARRQRIRIVRANLDPRDVRIRERMRLTSPPRTILDLAALLDECDLEALVAEAHFRGLAREPELRDQLDRNPRKRGTPKLRRVLDLPGGPRRTRSEGEHVLLRLLRSNGIGGFEVNARIEGYEVDFLWRAERFVVELDGYDGHSSRAAFERDRLKWARLQAAGIRVMPVTGRQIRDDHSAVVGRIASALGPR